MPRKPFSRRPAVSTRESFSRREFLQVSAGAVTAAFAVSTTACAPSEAARRPLVATQLYTLRDLLEEDFPGTFAQIAATGVDGVEFFGWGGYFGYTGTEMRRMMDDHGILAAGDHINLRNLRGDALQETIETNLALGNQYLVISGLSQQERATRNAVLTAANEMNEIADVLRPHGLYVGYHCHAFDFNEQFDGEPIWDILVNNTIDDVVLQIDVGNIAGTGVDLLELVRRDGPRVKSLHLKGHTYSGDSPRANLVGDDELPWGEIFAILDQVGEVDWYIIEQSPEPRIETLRQNVENVRQLLA